MSCLLFGAWLVVRPKEVAGFLGTPLAVLVELIGAGLVFNGVHLFWASLRRRIYAAEIYYFVTGDLAWATLTLELATCDVFLTTPRGVTVSLAVAAWVALMGIGQVWALAGTLEATLTARGVLRDHLPPHLSTMGAIAASWLSMKSRVKAWMCMVNLVFLGTLLFLPDPTANFMLAAYMASGPWLLAIMIAQRGLTRFLGVAHLVPWLPLLLVLLTHIRELPVYYVVAAVVIAICLAFDVYDLVRWFAGERFRLGAEAAARAGASILAPVPRGAA
jgi:hypothetical protein